MHLIFRACVHGKSHNTGLVAFVHLTYCVDNTCRIYTYRIVIKKCMGILQISKVELISTQID
jgi:hypothetical protein